MLATHKLSFSMAEAEKVLVLISSFFQVSPGPTQRWGAGLSCVCTVWPGREDSSLPQRSQCGLCWSGIPHLGSTQELHHPLLEIGKLHKGKTLNQESTVHCNIYCCDSRTSSVTANPGKVWNDSLSYLWGNATCSNHADSESQLYPALGHRNCQDSWKSSTNLNTTIAPIIFEVLWEQLRVFSFHLM